MRCGGTPGFWLTVGRGGGGATGLGWATRPVLGGSMGIPFAGGLS